MTRTIPTTEEAAVSLRDALGDRVILPGDPAYDTARTPWNLAIDQRPFAIAQPESIAETVDVVRAALASGLRVAPQSTGHGAAALSDTDLSTAMLVSLSRLRGVTVDPVGRSARVLGGGLWSDVLAEAAPHGLTGLHGSAGDVSVAGYALSGGLSFYARSHGLAANSVRSVTLVTADGALTTANSTENPDLFWAVRGGSGAFGVVVEVEIDLIPLPDVFAGILLWDAAHAADVSRAWARWTATAPESATTTLRIMHLPALPDLPAFLAGRSVVIIDGAITETDAAASALLTPLRDLAPEVDTFARIPAAELIHVHLDPPQPVPGLASHATLTGIPPEALDAYVTTAMASRPTVSELRHVGGAAARRPEGAGAVAAIDAPYLLNVVAIVPAPDAAAAALASTRDVVDALEPWHADSVALTFLDGGVDRRPGYGASAARLAKLKRQYDPEDVFAAANPV